ncbi:hypothetical protein ACUNWD_03825 [Sunxiuqinia sp. A32]|uniref:hypothetical protein n=1 Tax=Sunxiuqinia sp. A32 TaxID=3461496 RepID=UPI004045F4D5
MAISQAFNPFEHAVGSSSKGSNWIIILIIVAMLAGIGYYIYKDVLNEKVTIN